MFVIYIKNGMKNTTEIMLSYLFLDQICVEVSWDFFFGGRGGIKMIKRMHKRSHIITYHFGSYMYPVVLLFLPSSESKCNEYPLKKNAHIRTIKLIRSVELCISVVINHL